MGSLGPQEILVIVFVGLLVFGPDKLPELARNLGKFVATVRRETSRSVEELKRAADLQGLDQEIRSISNDLKDVRSNVTRAFTDGGGSGTKPGAALRVPARATPAPFDPDAT